MQVEIPAREMALRIATLNMEQDHKRWASRRELIVEQLAAIDPDLFAMNEVCIPLQSARWIQEQMRDRHGRHYALVQQTRVNGLSSIEGEALLTRLPIVETGNLDFRTRDMVALVARVQWQSTQIDVYVTHLFMSRGDESLRVFQVRQLLDWIATREDVAHRIVCGDFNATLDKPSAALMAEHFRPTQFAPTAFTPLADDDGNVSHPNWPRMDRCIDYIWISESIEIAASRVAFDRGHPVDSSLYPSDHAGVWADLVLRDAPDMSENSHATFSGTPVTLATSRG
jgi:endonuclease/exonuclease/phosphatase family metal-dependent hydrolase